MTPAEKYHSDQAERRTTARYHPDEVVDIEFQAEGRRLRAVVQDVSMNGMRLGLPGGCSVGSPVLLDHPVAGSFRGICVWRDDHAVGIQFVEPAREIERVLQCICLLIGLTGNSRAAK